RWVEAGAHRGRQSHGPQSGAQPEGKHRDRAKRRAAGNSQEPRARQRVVEESLHDHAACGESGADHRSDDGPRDAKVADDQERHRVAPPAESGNDASQRKPHFAERKRSEKGGEEQRHEQPEDPAASHGNRSGCSLRARASNAATRWWVTLASSAPGSRMRRPAASAGKFRYGGDSRSRAARSGSSVSAPISASAFQVSSFSAG